MFFKGEGTRHNFNGLKGTSSITIDSKCADYLQNILKDKIMDICCKNMDVQAMKWKHKLEQRENVSTKEVQGKFKFIYYKRFIC